MKLFTKLMALALVLTFGMSVDTKAISTEVSGSVAAITMIATITADNPTLSFSDQGVLSATQFASVAVTDNDDDGYTISVAPHTSATNGTQSFFTLDGDRVSGLTDSQKIQIQIAHTGAANQTGLTVPSQESNTLVDLPTSGVDFAWTGTASDVSEAYSVPLEIASNDSDSYHKSGTYVITLNVTATDAS